METKEEDGLVYYKVDGEWKLAGRAGHPMTNRYIELLKGNPTCVCGNCKPDSEN